MKLERILITVKTYPTLSRKYGETVCTAGVREDGSWVRIYPVPFRRLGANEQYRKYDWIECRLRRRTNDPRPESYSPMDFVEMTPVGHMDTTDKWRERRNLLLETSQVYDRLNKLIDGAKSNIISLAVFKPKSVSDFIWENEDKNWDPQKLEQMRALYNQMDLFDDNSWRETFKVIPKMPFSFSYRFEDVDGRQSELQILDWEVGALYWNCLRSSGNDQKEALKKVRMKYYDEFLKTDLHFFVGTTQRFHSVAPNPWVIIGVLPIPHDTRLRLL